MENPRQHEFQPQASNRSWAGNIATIGTKVGWRHLTVLIDLFSFVWSVGRLISGWMPIWWAGPSASGRRSHRLLLHTDQGSQYRARDYCDLLRKREIICSMSAKGCCWNNAVAEIFFSTLKLELDLDDNRDTLISPQLLKHDLALRIEAYYNRERRHSTIVYISPIVYEQQIIACCTLNTVNP
ncbi:DDE-type integrase/transposase/recombinase [Cyanobium sp. LEGE 06143]|uniref:DDE-type integrase/transposase/recombinase n=1 Tax=Cyanobium sp. LEGE 06143 TaxID=945727 RepID=UPI00187EF58B|nr:DDE-type integrase/transposase/recombinase [Cyanobium sp. LEGE 06143]MBE9171715.1 DDE-type integrase/transposase/recombinase [Cyanobium sp. LEGE 06143]